KTGTLTQPSASTINYVGQPLTPINLQIVAAIVAQSIHPLSQKIKKYIGQQQLVEIKSYQEIIGKGIQAVVNDQDVLIGSASYVQANLHQPQNNLATRVYINISNQVLGYFEMEQGYRKGLQEVLNQLAPWYNQYLLSGDNDKERENLKKYFTQNQNLLFNQSPADKLKFISNLQQQHKKVVMIGDGLNDAGALKMAHVGISVTENTAHFSPASDVIMDANEFLNLPKFFKFSKNTLKVIHISFLISLLYNIVGLSFAVQGTLSPLIAAILMPISSVTVIAFTTLTTTYLAKKGGLQ
ncbi:MAG: HAD-IC family P-type ATPase, partial [Bacteroidia bacterium]|nr:HAD-IC family P-type ATPase [Bacteroidia bacterium]